MSHQAGILPPGNPKPSGARPFDGTYGSASSASFGPAHWISQPTIGGFHGDTPIAGWFKENPNLKWMILMGSPFKMETSNCSYQMPTGYIYSLCLSRSVPSQLTIDSHVSHPEALEADYMKEVGSDDEFGPHQLDQSDS